MFEDDIPKDEDFKEKGPEKLIEEIKSDSSCEVYGISSFSQKKLRTISLLVLIPCIVMFFILIGIPDLLFAGIALVVIPSVLLLTFLFYAYLNHALKYFKTYISDRGVAKDAEGYSGAILWENLEYIEIKTKGDKIVYLVFRSGDSVLGYRSSYFAKLITLPVISKHFDGFNEWPAFRDFEEHVDADIIFVRPGVLEQDRELKELDEIHLREYIGYQDYVAGYETEEHPGAKTDEDLFALIEEDPQCVVFHDTGRLAKVMSSGKIMYTFLAISILVAWYGMFNVYGSAIWVVIGISVLFLLPTCYGFFKWYEKLVMSPIGVGRHSLGSPEAIEWQHVEKVDVAFENEKLVQVEFYGNRRRIFCPQHIYKDLIKMDDIKRYLPEIEDWELVKKKSWPEGHVRYVRPS